MTGDETFTVVPNEMLEGRAASCLGSKAYVLLMLAWRRWQLQTRNGKRDCSYISMNWTGVAFPMARNTFSKARRELVKKGFLEPVNVSQGRYVFGNHWRNYEPSAVEDARHREHRAARRERVRRTRQYRKTGRRR